MEGYGWSQISLNCVTSMAYPNSSPASTQPISVINPLFCSPQPVDLVLSRKGFSSDIFVTDVNGNIIFQVKGNFWSFSGRRVLDDASGNPLVSMEPRHFSTRMRWRAFRGDSSDFKDILFSLGTSSLIQFGGRKMDVFLAANTNEENCDFKIKWNRFERSCTIYRGKSDTIIAQMSNEYTIKNILLWKNTIKVTIYPGVDHAFIVALVVIVDQINRNANSSSNNHNNQTTH